MSELTRSHKVRWSDVWCNGENLFALVARELGRPLRRDLEIPSKVSERNRNPFFRLMWAAGLHPVYLWRDLEAIDTSVCAGVSGVGPNTILRLASELAFIARDGEDVQASGARAFPADEMQAAVNGVIVDEVTYAMYGGSTGGYVRLLRSSTLADLPEHTRVPNVANQLLASNLQESKRVLRNMLSGIEKGGQLLTTEKIVRCVWDESDLASLLNSHGVPDRSGLLDSLENAVRVLRERLSEGKSIEEIAKARGKHVHSIHMQIANWARYIPADLCQQFSSLDDHRIYEIQPPTEVAPNSYRYPFVPGRCLNCDSTDVLPPALLYCSEMCRQSAKVVRYARARIRDGSIDQGDIREALRMKVAQVLAGGYAERDRRIPLEVRRTVMQAAEGHCQRCGRSFNSDDRDTIATIQHISGSSSELSNLEAWCRRCNMADAQSRFAPIEPGSGEFHFAKGLQDRWTSPLPLRMCDDDERWNETWREASKEAKEELRFQAEVSEGAGDEDLPGFMGWTPNGTPIQDF